MFTTPILIAGVMVLAYRGFKAHKNNDEAGQTMFLKSFMLLAFIQCAETATDMLSWVPGYSIVKTLLLFAVVFPTETTQRILYNDRLAPLIASTSAKIGDRLTAARASVSTAALSRATALCHWLLTETDCVRYVSAEELASLSDVTAAVTQKVKSENTRRLRASLPTAVAGTSSSPAKTTVITISAIDSSIGSRPAAAPAFLADSVKLSTAQFAADTSAMPASDAAAVANAALYARTSRSSGTVASSATAPSSAAVVSAAAACAVVDTAPSPGDLSVAADVVVATAPVSVEVASATVAVEGVAGPASAVAAANTVTNTDYGSDYDAAEHDENVAPLRPRVAAAPLTVSKRSASVLNNNANPPSAATGDASAGGSVGGAIAAKNVALRATRRTRMSMM